MGVKSFKHVLHNAKNNFSDKDKQEALKRFLDKCNVKSSFPKFVQNIKEFDKFNALLKTQNLHNWNQQIKSNVLPSP
jgi:hypothetical protein